MDETVRKSHSSDGPFLNILRLQGCQRDVEVWQRILQVRTLVLKPEDAPQMWIKFANLCRKSDRMVLAEKTIEFLLSGDRVRKSQSEMYLCSLSSIESSSYTRTTKPQSIA